MGRFANDPDFTLVWPPDVFAEELQRLIRRGRKQGMTKEWAAEVELLLRQAFQSTVPVTDFTLLYEAPDPSNGGYSFDEEPF